MYVQQIEGAWVPALWPYRDASGKKYDTIAQLDEVPGRRAAAGYFPAVFTSPAPDLEAIAWDTGTLAGDTVTFAATGTVTKDPNLPIKKFVKTMDRLSIPASIAALDVAKPGMLMSYVLISMFGYEDAVKNLADLGALNLPTKKQLRDIANEEKVKP